MVVVAGREWGVAVVAGGEGTLLLSVGALLLLPAETENKGGGFVAIRKKKVIIAKPGPKIFVSENFGR